METGKDTLVWASVFNKVPTPSKLQPSSFLPKSQLQCGAQCMKQPALCGAGCPFAWALRILLQDPCASTGMVISYPVHLSYVHISIMKSHGAAVISTL